MEFRNSSNQVVASITTSGNIDVAGSITSGGSPIGGASVNALNDIADVTAPSPSSGDFLKWNGSAWINDPINLGTDTTGNYMVNVSAGTGISVSHTQGEGSTATVSLSANLDALTDVATAGASNGNALIYNGASWAPGSVSASSADRTTEGTVYGKTTSAGGTVFLGYNSGSSVVSGSNNIAVGDSSLSFIGMGAGNVAIGNSALRNNSSNNYSVAIGYEAAYNAVGSENIAIGYWALRGSMGSSGSYNIAIGSNAGYNLGMSSTRNVFIGYQAGYNETGSDKLYISNSNTSSPLIKGDFASSTVEINGSLSYRQAFNNQGINTMVYLTSSDKGKVVTFNTSSNVTVYVNNFANLVAGERIDLLNLGTGTVSISGSGVTVNGTPGLKLRTQYSAGSLLCIQNNMSYVLIGDLAA